MRGGICGVLALFAVCALPVAARAQEDRPPNIEPANSGQLPYTAEFKATDVRILTDGATVTLVTTQVIARDSQGRSMVATTIVPHSTEQTPVTRVEVDDPVARTQASWRVPGQIATVKTLAPSSSGSDCRPTAPAAPFNAPPMWRARTSSEELGTETIQGIEARGRRTFIITPAGSAGNTESMVSTQESWMSIAPGLSGLVVRQVIDNPKLGKVTSELTRLNQAEPDPSLFAPPAGYVVQKYSEPVVTCPDATSEER